MSPIKKSLSLFLAMFALAAVTGGCSKQEATEEPQADVSAAAEESAAAETGEAAENSAPAMSPQDERHELMEEVLDAAKVVGPMLRGEADFDAASAMNTLQTWDEVGGKFGDLFPEGSEGGEAAPAIWEDREGFNAALIEWQDATAAAIAANPQTLDDAKASIGPVFNTCKNCHDTYRIEDE